MTAEAVDRGKLDIARVIQQTFAVLGRNFVTFFVLALLLAGLPSAGISYLMVSNVSGLETGQFSFDPALFGFFAASVLIAVATSAILQGAVIYGTVQDMNGARPNIGEALATGLRAFLPLLGVSILLSLALIFGFVLLIVPGLIMLCVWSVAVPALVAERTGVFGAFSRSAELTRGHRWRIFALLVVVFVIALVVSLVIGAILGVVASPDPVAAASNPVVLVGDLLIDTVVAVISATGAAVLYVELRRLREGAGPQWLADIFS